MAMADKEYLYEGDADAKAVIEHTSDHNFEKSSKARLVEFYSPVSVSSFKGCSIAASRSKGAQVMAHCLVLL